MGDSILENRQETSKFGSAVLTNTRKRVSTISPIDSRLTAPSSTDGSGLILASSISDANFDLSNSGSSPSMTDVISKESENGVASAIFSVTTNTNFGFSFGISGSIQTILPSTKESSSTSLLDAGKMSTTPFRPSNTSPTLDPGTSSSGSTASLATTGLSLILGPGDSGSSSLRWLSKGESSSVISPTIIETISYINTTDMSSKNTRSSSTIDSGSASSLGPGDSTYTMPLSPSDESRPPFPDINNSGSESQLVLTGSTPIQALEMSEFRPNLLQVTSESSLVVSPSAKEPILRLSFSDSISALSLYTSDTNPVTTPSTSESSSRPSISTIPNDASSGSWLETGSSISALSSSAIDISSASSLNTIESSSSMLQSISGTNSASFSGTRGANPTSVRVTTYSTSILFSDASVLVSTSLSSINELNSAVPTTTTGPMPTNNVIDSSLAALLGVTDSALTVASNEIFQYQLADNESRRPSVTHNFQKGAGLDSEMFRMHPLPQEGSRTCTSLPCEVAHLQPMTSYSISLNELAYHGSEGAYALITTSTLKVDFASFSNSDPPKLISTSHGNEVLSVDTGSYFPALDPLTGSDRMGDPTRTDTSPMTAMADKGQLARIDGSGSSMVLREQTTGVLLGTVVAAVVAFGAIFLFHNRCYHFFWRSRKDVIYIIHDQVGPTTYESPYNEISRFSEDS